MFVDMATENGINLFLIVSKLNIIIKSNWRETNLRESECDVWKMRNWMRKLCQESDMDRFKFKVIQSRKLRFFS